MSEIFTRSCGASCMDFSKLALVLEMEFVIYVRHCCSFEGSQVKNMSIYSNMHCIGVSTAGT